MNPLIRFKINEPEVTSETVDDEVIIISFDSGNYYSLNKVGADIWNFIKDGLSVDEIIQKITRCYGGNQRDVEDCIDQYLKELQKENLVISFETKKTETLNENYTEVDSTHCATKVNFEAPILHKYTDMSELLLLDPIHEVDDAGWPFMREDLSQKDINSDN